MRTNLTATVVIDQQSDAYVVRDFFESRYRENPQPKSFLEVDQLWSNWSLNFLTQPQLNDFFQTVERLPDAKLSGMRQQLDTSPFYYESESSLGYFAISPRKIQAARITPPFAPTHSIKSFCLRLSLAGSTLLPASAAASLTTAKQSRIFRERSCPPRTEAYSTPGREVSFKLSRLWSNARNKFWDADGIRHIIEPSVNYAFVPDPSVPPEQTAPV